MRGALLGGATLRSIVRACMMRSQKRTRASRVNDVG